MATPFCRTGSTTSDLYKRDVNCRTVKCRVNIEWCPYIIRPDRCLVISEHIFKSVIEYLLKNESSGKGK